MRLSPTHRTRTVLTCVVAAAGLAFGVAGSEAQEGCRTSPDAIIVNLDDTRTPAAVDDVRRAVAAGQPWLLHIDRPHEDVHRRTSLRGLPTRPGYDRDEYPPAVSAEGGAGAVVRLIPSGDNRSAGGKMGHVLGPYCDGQAFVFQP